MKRNRAKIKCIVAKSDKLLRDFICIFIEEKGIELVGKAENGIDTIKLMLDNKPDLLIAGAELQGISGPDLSVWIRQHELKTKVIIFSRIKSPTLVECYSENKLDGLLFFDDGVEEFSLCLDAVLMGKSYISEEASKFRISDGFSKQRDRAKQPSFSPTELKVLWELSLHLSIKQIAEKLSVSPNTVNNHLANMRQKTKLKGAHSLLKYALSIKHRLIEVDGSVWFRQDV